MRRTTNRVPKSSVLALALVGGLCAAVEADPAAQPTTQPANGLVPVTLQVGSGVEPTIRKFFAPRTQEDYFSPFDIMNPGHIRPYMPMEIGRYEDLHLNMGFQSVGRIQTLQQENVFIKGVKQAGLNPGFQDPFANLDFLASIPGKLDVYFDLYVASRPHPNTMYAHEGYLLFQQLPAPFDTGPIGSFFDYCNVKVGGFDIDFGDNNFHRSNNAFVQRNPLIGNPLVDPNVEEIGGEVYSKKGPVYWLVGGGNGTTTEHFDYGAGGSAHAKVWGYPLPSLRTSASFYWADLSGSANANEHSDLYAAMRSGGPYAAVFGGGDSPGQLLPQHGERILAAQADATWNQWPFEVYGNVGWTQDTDINGPAAGTPAERWVYGNIGPVYHITPALYVAGRYGFGLAQTVNGVNTNGWVDRIEVGAGYWITQTILGKAEYVYQQYHNFQSGTGVVSGVDAVNSPRFNGFLMEVSFQF